MPQESSNVLVWLLSQSVAFVVAIVWAILERRERRASILKNEQLSAACTQLIAKHSLELVSTENTNSSERVAMEKRHCIELSKKDEMHALLLDSSLRNVLAHYERTLKTQSQSSSHHHHLGRGAALTPPSQPAPPSEPPPTPRRPV